MTDFGPLISNPKSIFLGGAAQLGVFAAFAGALLLGFNEMEAAAIGIIGGADGPTAILVTKELAPHLLGAIAIAAYSYMALIPIIQPPFMKLLTTEKERSIKMTNLRSVSKLEKEGVILPMYYAVVRVREGFDVDFIYHLLKSDIFPRELHKIVEGTTLKIIKTTHLKEITLPIPDYETQVKYGRLFKLMDKRINLNQELIELERQNEKLIMKNLFEKLEDN